MAYGINLKLNDDWKTSLDIQNEEFGGETAEDQAFAYCAESEDLLLSTFELLERNLRVTDHFLD